MEIRKWLLVIMVFFTATSYLFAQNKPVQLTADVKMKVIDSLSIALNKNYVFADTAVKMGVYIKDKFKKGGYNSINNPNEFAQTLTADLRTVYRDLHLSVSYDPGLATNLQDTSKNAAIKRRIQNFNIARKQNFGFSKIEILKGNIGYIYFDRFFSVNDRAKETVNTVFAFLKNTDALIIDVRNNGGGDPEMVRYICSYFFKEKTHINDMYERRVNKTYQYWTEPVAFSNQFSTVPIYVLVSDHTFSGAEEFAYDLQNQHRATIIGETTGGGAHPVSPEPIGNGFTGNIPFARAINPVSGKNWEAIGVKPDIHVSADSALDVATISYYDYQISTSKDPGTIKSIKWVRNMLNAKLHPFETDPSLLNAYVGNYNGRMIILDAGSLYSIAKNGNKALLTPLSQTTFVNDNRLIEFRKNPDGKVTETVTFDDGFVVSFKREE